MSVTEEVVSTKFKSHQVKLTWQLNEWRLSRQYHGSQSKHLSSGPIESLHCKWELELQFQSDASLEPKVASKMRACLYLLDCDMNPSSVVLQGSLGIQKPGGGWYVYSKLFGVLSVFECKVSDFWNISSTDNDIEIVADLSVLVGNPTVELESSRLTSNIVSDDDHMQAERLSEDLESLLTNDTLCDVTAYVNNTAFHGHKAIFGARSPVFKSQLEKPNKEKRGGVELEVDCTKNTEAWSEFCKFLYTGRISLDDEDEMLNLGDDLFLLAEAYEVFPLAEHLEVRLTNLLTRDNVIDILEIAYKHGLSKLVDLGRTVIKAELNYLRTEKKDEIVKCLANPQIAELFIDTMGVK